MDRPHYLKQIARQFAVHPVVALLGPRQCGKTTLARMFAEASPGLVTRFDLEDPTDLAALAEPRLALQALGGLVIIDEIQRLPDLFPVLRVLADRPDNAGRFLILGSASRDLIRQSSETLAGRIGHIELTPFTLPEVGAAHMDRLWLRGGFPRSFLAPDEDASNLWRRSYVATFLERDLPALGIAVPPQALRRFWMMLAHYHGQLVNFSELGRSFGAADTTVRRYLDILAATFMVRLLQPWHANVAKRQVKAPKLYLRDAGLFHTLMGITGRDALIRHPKLGASWEGFAIEEIIRRHDQADVYFWSAYGRAEVDLVVFGDGPPVGYEVKYTERPQLTRSMQVAMETLGLEELRVVHPGDRSFALAERVRAIGLAGVTESGTRPQALM
ncbi:MAG: ATP-binding protein [Betaproteobacteria bacterium]|nr:ATP-binding protein [Betaproteobacteria bacterium]